MFKLESELTPAVARWMSSRGLQIKQEFITPWGICDLVGLMFNARHAKRRLKLKQFTPISSIIGGLLLHELPDVETSDSISMDDLAFRLDGILSREEITGEIDRLKAKRYVITSDSGRLQKVNGWMPIYKRFIAVELKLGRIEEALHQASNNLAFAPESFAAFPLPVAKRIMNSSKRWQQHFDQGVGLIGVTPESCRVLIESRQSNEFHDPVIRFCSAEKFWRTRKSITSI